jgi:integrase
MDPTPTLALPSGTGSGWDEALYAFLVEKGNRSGSRRTVDTYSRMLWPFFAGTSPDRVRPPDVLAFAYRVGPSGRPPSSATIGARIACLSSYYRFLIRMDRVRGNPCDAVERPRTTQATARGYSAAEVRRLLAVIPDTVAGRRDRAVILTLVLTGRRRSEVLALTAGDLSSEEDRVFYRYRGKGNKRGRRELPAPAYRAIKVTLADAGLDLESMERGASLWQAGTRGGGLTSSTLYGRFRRYLRLAGLEPTGLHVLRHSAAKLRRDAGETIEAVSAFLDHSSLAVTTVYLRRLEGELDLAWFDVAAAIGVSSAD